MCTRENALSFKIEGSTSTSDTNGHMSMAVDGEKWRKIFLGIKHSGDHHMYKKRYRTALMLFPETVRDFERYYWLPAWFMDFSKFKQLLLKYYFWVPLFWTSGQCLIINRPRAQLPRESTITSTWVVGRFAVRVRDSVLYLGKLKGAIWVV